jgi:hypothetical protein
MADPEANREGPTRRRRGPGRPWPKATSGNPRGRPPVYREVRELAQAHAPAALRVIVAMLEDADAGICLRAGREILDRAIGRAPHGVLEPKDGAETLEAVLARKYRGGAA